MPHYDYKCDAGHEFEIEQRITADALKVCYFRETINSNELEGLEGYGTPIKQRVCGAPCRRLISKTSFTFKGGAPTPKGGMI